MNKLLVAAALIMGTSLACAQDVTIEKKTERPGIVVPVPAPGVTVERREKIETTGRGPANCDTKTVQKDTPAGSSTTKKERCY